MDPPTLRRFVVCINASSFNKNITAPRRLASFASFQKWALAIYLMATNLKGTRLVRILCKLRARYVPPPRHARHRPLVGSSSQQL